MRGSLAWIPLLALSAPTGVAKNDEWFQECQGDECGYSASSRGNANCQDEQADCRKFALAGECKTNPSWMLQTCQQSCGLCFSKDPQDEPCKDMHTSCSQWSNELECFANPLFMSRACPKSCWLCVNATDLREEGLSEKEITRRIRFSQTDFGLWQSIPESNHDKVKKLVVEMGRYTHNLEKTGPGTLCNNQFHECAQWIVENGGCEANLEFMLAHCSLACKYCDVIEQFHDCRTTRPVNTPISFVDVRAIQMHLSHDMGAENALRTFPEKLESNEWIFVLEHSDLWKSSEDTLKELSRAVKSESGPLRWRDASLESFADLPPDKRPTRSGRLATCDKLCQKKSPAFASLAASIADLLQVQPQFLQSLEFVHYKRGERFSAHHDFRIHDQWKHSGNRVLTVFVSIQNPEEGGNFGFPEYDWLQVSKPQVIVWPNVASKTPLEALGRMKSEKLPVVYGEMYGVYAVLRQYPYDSSNSCA